MKLYLTYDESHSGGGVFAGEDENITWSLRECCLTRDTDHWLQEEVEVDFKVTVGDPVWVVYVRYGTGNTFGHTNGAWIILGVYDNFDQANKIKESVENDTYDGYECWKGYFRSLESCDIEKMNIID